MFAKLYHLRNILNVGIHYSAAAGLATGAVMLGQPWMVVTGVALSGGLSVFINKKAQEYARDILVQHPDAHEFSPQLGQMVQNLAQKAGFKEGSFAVYDFKADNGKKSDVSDFWQKLFGDIFNTMGKTHNAAAMGIGKPVIMISEPLLKLLDDDEEKAVLAHEFTHAAARHTYLGLPSAIVMGTARTIAGLTKLVSVLSTGVGGIIASLIGGNMTKKGVAKAYRMLHKDGDQMNRPLWPTTPGEKAFEKKVDTAKRIAGNITASGILAYFNPAFLGIYAAATGIGLTSRVISGAFSRSNEYQADRGAVTLGADPLALVTALRKMTVVMEESKKDLFNGDIPKSGWLTRTWNKLTATHPETTRRIERLAGYAREQGAPEAAITAAVSGPIVIPPENKIPYDVMLRLMRL